MPGLVIRFINDVDIVSKLITWSTNSLWCHTEALSRDGTTWVGAHAHTGVNARKLDWCKPSREAVYEIPVGIEAYDRAYTWLESKIGEPYNYADIIGLTLHNRLGHSDTSVICSALMTEFMMQAGLFPLNCLEEYAYLVTPEMLHLSPLFIGRRRKVVQNG